MHKIQQMHFNFNNNNNNKLKFICCSYILHICCLLMISIYWAKHKYCTKIDTDSSLHINKVVCIVANCQNNA